MSAETSIRTVLRGISAALRSRDVRWYLFGAQAVMIWGRPRTSADVDVTASFPLEEAHGVIRAMDEEGFEIRVEDVAGFVQRTRVLPFLHADTGIPVDLVVAGPGLEEQFLDRAIDVEIGSLKVPVISPEDLLVGKTLAGRPKDLEDVRGILQRRLGELDLQRVRDLLAQIESALGRSDLTASFERELVRTEKGSR